jgi:isoquinoline 1-oxidoreductase beta subunit
MHSRHAEPIRDAPAAAGGSALAARITRREFLAAGSAAGLCLVLEVAPAAESRAFGATTQLAAFLDITPDNVVSIVTPDLEIGQGIYTSLPLILADELGADWPRVEVRQSWADERFVNPMKGIQATGRSMSVRGQYDLLRRLGATARTLLCQAAAEQWGVAATECTARASEIVHAPSGRRRTFGSLVAAAAKLPLPPAEKVRLRPDSELALIGRDQPRKDVPAKVTGTAVFGIDIRLPGMLVAAIHASPVFGSPLREADEARVRKMPGVAAVVKLPDAVAVVADNYWQASNALRALEPRFAASPNDRVDSAALASARRSALAEPGVLAVERGAVLSAPPAGTSRIEMDYEVPYLAHATMEPMNATALVTDAGCRILAPTQGPIRLRDAVAEALGLPVEKVTVERTFGGGGFGRRWQVDFGVQAALIAREVKGRPVKLVWSRAEDMRHDFYRPAFNARMTADIAPEGGLAALDVKLAGASISEWGRPGRLQGKADVLAVSTFNDAPYDIPNYRVRWVATPAHVPVGVWRSVGQSHNGFFLECAIDEAAHAAGRDPLQFRLDLLAAHPRFQNVLRTVAKRAGWGAKLPQGEGMGIAVVEDQASIVGQVARVRVADGRLRVLEVCCAIDLGKVVQPEVVRMQMEGGIIFGLSALFYGAINIANGAARESNFHDYRMLSLADTPSIAVDIIEGGLPFGGVGEPGVPPLAPAVVNAIFSATGRRIRSLPLSLHGLV